MNVKNFFIWCAYCAIKCMWWYRQWSLKPLFHDISNMALSIFTSWGSKQNNISTWTFPLSVKLYRSYRAYLFSKFFCKIDRKVSGMVWCAYCAIKCVWWYRQWSLKPLFHDISNMALSIFTSWGSKQNNISTWTFPLSVKLYRSYRAYLFSKFFCKIDRKVSGMGAGLYCRCFPMYSEKLCSTFFGVCFCK